MKTPAISVLMSVYSGENYLKESIESILGQTFINFEFLIIDDGSTDRSKEIIESYKDNRIVYIKNETNIGLTKSLNKGIELAKGKYIARMDADDISLPNRLEKQLSIFQEFPRMQVVFSTIQMINQNGSTIKNWEDDLNCISQRDIYLFLPQKNCLAHPTLMAERSILLAYKYDNSIEMAQDYHLWLRLASDDTEFYKIKEPLLKYRIHSESITQFSNSKKSGEIKKNINIKYRYILGKIKKLSLNHFDSRVIKYLLTDIFSLSKIFIKDELKKYLIKFGSLVYKIYPKKWNFQNVFFFPSYQMGGAERVHIDILKAVHAINPTVIICNNSQDSFFMHQFKKYAYALYDIPFLSTSFFLRYFFLGYISASINLCGKKMVLFGSNCSFFYLLLPLLNKKKYFAIDLFHAFSPGSPEPLEVFSLEYLNYLSKRIIVNPALYQDFEKLYLQKSVNSDALKKIEIIENGIYIPDNFIEKNGLIFNILYVGRCAKEKRVHLVGEVAKRCEELGLPVQFILLGVEKKCIGSSYEKYCTFIGQVKDPSPYYVKSHILLVTSSSEGFPMTIMEAMAYGVVPLSVDVGGIGYHIQDRINGFLVENGNDEERIVSEIVELVRQSVTTGCLKSMSRKAYCYAKEHFSIRVFEKKYQDLLIKYTRG